MKIIPRFVTLIAIIHVIFSCICDIGIAYSDSTKVPDPEHVYGMLGVVTEIDPIEDLVSVSNWNGDKWSFYGVDDWFLGDFVSLTMWDNDTPDTIYDDVILSAHYERVDLVIKVLNSIQDLD